MNARAAGESVASRWMRPSSRHRAGRSGATTAPCSRATSAIGARHDRGARAGEHERDDRLALVGLDGDRGLARRLPSNAASSVLRVEVPAGSVTSGWRASASTSSRRGASVPGREDRDQLLAAERDARAAASAATGSSVMPTSLSPDRTESTQRRDVLGVGEAHRDVRVGAAERADERRDGIDGERRQGDEVEMTGDDAGDGVDLGPEGVERPHHLASRGHERLACRRQRRAAADAMEQLDSELALERADRVGERWLGDEAGRGGGRERALVDDRERVAQLVELHR